MSFAIGLLCFILGSAAVAVCLLALPGRPGAAPAPAHDGGHGHGH